MKIKIIRASAASWYRGKIGKVYKARINVFLNGYFIVRNYRTILRTVDINDAEIIEK